MATKAAKEQRAGRRVEGEQQKEAESRVKGKEELQTGSTLITMLQKSLTAELHGTGLQPEPLLGCLRDCRNVSLSLFFSVCLCRCVCGILWHNSYSIAKDNAML